MLYTVFSKHTALDASFTIKPHRDGVGRRSDSADLVVRAFPQPVRTRVSLKLVQVTNTVDRDSTEWHSVIILQFVVQIDDGS